MRISDPPNKGKPQSLRGAAPSGDRVFTEAAHREQVSPSILHLEGDVWGEKQRCLISLRFHAGSTVPPAQCRRVSIALLLSSYPDATAIPRGLKELTWVGETGPWPEKLLCWPCPFPSGWGALTVHSSAALTLAVARSSLSSALPATPGTLDLSQKDIGDGSIRDFSHVTTLPKDLSFLIFLILIPSCIALTVLVDFWAML